jgi:hypothetical protein
MKTTWRFIKYTISLAIFGLALSGCVQSDYTKLVKSELVKGIRKDSILLGINFGDTKDDFYGRCFDLNKKQLVTQGPNGVSVQYLFTDSLVHDQPTPIRLLFKPGYDEKKVISDMDVELSYQAWAPWNVHLQSDSLKIKMMKLFMLWYKGNEFITVNLNDSTNMPVKLDGNRRVLIYVKDTQSITVKIQDILHPKFKHSGTSSEIKEDSKK